MDAELGKLHAFFVRGAMQCAASGNTADALLDLASARRVRAARPH